jgi:DNA polymerase III delta prime subunit
MAHFAKTWLTYAPELIARLHDGLPLTVLGQTSLPEPLGGLLVLGRSDGGPQGGASLAAAISVGGNSAALVLASFGFGPLSGVLRQPALPDRFITRTTPDGLYVLDEHGDELFAVGQGLLKNQLVVACGTWPLLAPVFGAHAKPRPVRDRAVLEGDLDTFCAVVAAVVDGVYDKGGTKRPNASMTLRPTTYGVGSAMEGLRQLGQVAERFVSNLPKAPVEQQGPQSQPGSTATGSPASFADVGGQETAIRELQAICLAIRDPEAYRRWGARPPKGVLLYGPPGTGKTLMARCLAHEAGARFLHVKAVDVASKWYGEAEQRLAQAFEWARKETPAVLFFDEIDALARVRDDSHEVTQRLVSTLLENMDGLQEARGVVVVAATNRPAAVDPAITRPGRFDRLVEVPLPDRAGRRAIFDVHMRKAEAHAGRQLFERAADADWHDLLDTTAGFSGAEIEETVRRTLEVKVRSGATGGRVTLAGLMDEAQHIKPSW